MKKTAIIIDDSIFMRTLITQLLTSMEYDVVGEAVDGETAISMALNHKPDLITLDNILPDMLGIDVLRILKEDEHIPSKIVIVSAVGQDNVVQEGLSLGAADYLVKPFTSEKFTETIHKIMSV